MCGVFFEGTGGNEVLIVYILGTMTKGCYKWTVVSCLCTHVKVGYYSYATDMLQLVPLVQYTQKLSCYNIKVHKVLAQYHNVTSCRSMFWVIFTLEHLFLWLSNVLIG